MFLNTPYSSPACVARCIYAKPSLFPFGSLSTQKLFKEQFVLLHVHKCHVATSSYFNRIYSNYIFCFNIAFWHKETLYIYIYAKWTIKPFAQKKHPIMCAGCFAIAGRSQSPVKALYYGWHGIKGFSQHGGLCIYIYNPACGHLPGIGTQTLFFLEMRTKKSKESAVISNQLDHGVGQAFVSQCLYDIFQWVKLFFLCFCPLSISNFLEKNHANYAFTACRGKEQGFSNDIVLHLQHVTYSCQSTKCIVSFQSMIYILFAKHHICTHIYNY